MTSFMHRVIKLTLLGLFVPALAWGQASGPNSGSGGGGTPITSGAGDFGSSTSQSGGVLTGTVVNGSNMAGSASIPDSALATPHTSNGAAGKVQLSNGSGNFTGVSMAQDATMDGSGNVTVQGIQTKSVPTLPGSSSALVYSGTAFAWDPFFPNPLSATGDLLVGVTNVNTAPTRLPDVAVGSVLTSGGVGANPVYGQVPIAAMPANNSISATNSVTGTAGSNQAVLFEDGFPWMHYLGDGSEADPNITSGTTSIQGVHRYATLTVGVSGTLAVTFSPSTSGSPTDKPNGSLIAFVQGACTIAGTISANAITPANINGWGGASGGGGGYGAANGTAGASAVLPGGTSAAPIAAGGSGGTSGNPGSAGSTPTTSGINDVLMGTPQWANCGGAAGGQGGSSGATPGLGGGCVYLICGSINFTGTINVAGGNGNAAGSSGVGGGGGGGGGAVVLAGRTVINSGTITLTGGTGGASFGSGTSTAGGNGGTGWSKVFTLN